MKETANYKKYMVRQFGLTESQFVPLPKKEAIEPQISPTARPPTILALGIRGSTSGGLPSGADQLGTDISPSKVGGYDRVEPQNLNSTVVNKTPDNPEIKQSNVPINTNPSTEAGVTHPHQIQVTAHEEPQSVTGASTDSDSTLTLKSATPKGIEVDIPGENQEPEQAVHDEDDHTAMIPATSLSETFARHKRLMRERMGFTEAKNQCLCGCEGTCQCPPNCKCKKNKNGVCECATCGCGDPNDKHEDEANEEYGITKSPGFFGDFKVGDKVRISHGSGVDSNKLVTIVDPSNIKTNGQGIPTNVRGAYKPVDWDRESAIQYDDGSFGTMFNNRLTRSTQQDEATDSLPQVKEPNFIYCTGCGKKMETTADDRGQTKTCDKCLGYKPGEVRGGPLAEGKHKKGCECGFCKNKGNFGKKKDVEEGSHDEDDDAHASDPDFHEKDEKEFRKSRSASAAGDEVHKHFDKDKKKVDEQQRLDESYAAPFARMRSLAGVGNMVLTSNGLFENKNDPGASKPFNTHWKMDKEKAGFVKIDEEKLKKVKADLDRKSKRGSLSDKELELARRLDEVLKRRRINETSDDSKETGKNPSLRKCEKCGKTFTPSYGEYSRCQSCLANDTTAGEMATQ